MNNESVSSLSMMFFHVKTPRIMSPFFIKHSRLFNENSDTNNRCCHIHFHVFYHFRLCESGWCWSNKLWNHVAHDWPFFMSTFRLINSLLSWCKKISYVIIYRFHLRGRIRSIREREDQPLRIQVIQVFFSKMKNYLTYQNIINNYNYNVYTMYAVLWL